MYERTPTCNIKYTLNIEGVNNYSTEVSLYNIWCILTLFARWCKASSVVTGWASGGRMPSERLGMGILAFIRSLALFERARRVL